jgi:hypothetical protein
LQAQEAPADGGELECVLANLIFEGRLRGYIAHKQQFLVLSKDNPFPATAAT